MTHNVSHPEEEDGTEHRQADRRENS
jgi:hypothetical protein